MKPIYDCEDPAVVVEEVKRLNREVVQGFVNLVHDLVHQPAENKKRRNELLRLIEQLSDQANKFREHQSRELLIEVLEKQLEQREKFILELEEKIEKVDAILGTEEWVCACFVLGFTFLEILSEKR